MQKKVLFAKKNRRRHNDDILFPTELKLMIKIERANQIKCHCNSSNMLQLKTIYIYTCSMFDYVYVYVYVSIINENQSIFCEMMMLLVTVPTRHDTIDILQIYDLWSAFVYRFVFAHQKFDISYRVDDTVHVIDFAMNVLEGGAFFM